MSQLKVFDGTQWVTVGQGGGILPAGSRKTIQRQVVTTPVQSLTFTVPTSGYTAFVLTGVARKATATGEDLVLYFNGDTASNYRRLYWMRNPSGENSGDGTVDRGGIPVAFINGSGDPAGHAIQFESTIIDPHGTNFRKLVTTRNTAVYLTDVIEIHFGGGEWKNTAALTTITLTLGAGQTLAAGSWVELYGITDSDQVAGVPYAAQTVDEVVLSVDQTDVRFPASGNLPTGYASWELIISGRGSAAANEVDVAVQFNGDTGSNYEFQRLAGINATAYEDHSLTTAVSIGVIPGNSATVNRGGVVQATIGDPEGTTFHKATVGRSSDLFNASNRENWVTAGLWLSTAAITSIVVKAGLKAGTRLTLIGKPKVGTPRTA